MTKSPEALRSGSVGRKQTVALIGAPLNLGAGRPGSEQGPTALRRNHLADRLRLSGHEVIDFGDLTIPSAGACAREKVDRKYVGAIRRACEALFHSVDRAIEAGHFPLILGGDHSLAMGSVAGTSRTVQQRKEELGLLWIDAHGDMNTPETTESGLIHGMPLAHLLGKGDETLASIGGFTPKVGATRVALVGVRDLDDRERIAIRESKLTVFTMNDIDRLGVAQVMKSAIEVVTKGTAGFHLSFDLDVVDPNEAPGVNTPVRGGLTGREARLTAEMVAHSGKMIAMDVVELNPLQDRKDCTAKLACDLILAALGRVIL